MTAEHKQELVVQGWSHQTGSWRRGLRPSCPHSCRGDTTPCWPPGRLTASSPLETSCPRSQPEINQSIIEMQSLNENLKQVDSHLNNLDAIGLDGDK